MSAVNLSESSNFDHIVVGFIYSSISLIDLVFYIPCMIVMYKETEFQHSCFMLLRNQGVADIINIFQMFVLGIIVMGNISVPMWFDKYFFGTTSQFAWQSYVALCHTIALKNRCVIVCFVQHQTTFFSERATKLWIVACWIHAGLWWFPLMMPWLNYQYSSFTYSIYFDLTTSFGQTAHIITWWESAILILLSGFWYLVIVIYLRVERHSMPAESTQANQSVQQQEKQIMKQAGVICMFAIVLNQYWCISGYTPYYQYKFVFGNILWILNSGINPLVYMTMNATIRNKVKEMFGMKQNSNQPLQQRENMKIFVKSHATQKNNEENVNDMIVEDV